MAFFNKWYIKLQGESTSQDLSLWGVQTHVSAEIAKPKTSYQDVSGLNGAIDRSDIGTGVKYKNRTIKMYLVIRDEDIPAASGFTDAQAVYEEFARKYHGQRVEISRSTDSIGGNWQRYKGRLQVSKDSKTTVIRLVTCTIEADPFVYFDDGTETVTPTYKTQSTFGFYAGAIVEDGGLEPIGVGETGLTTFRFGNVGRYAIWNFPVLANTVDFPSTFGDTTLFDVDFLTSDGEIIELDNGGYYSTVTGNIKVKITAKTKFAFSAGINTIHFDYIPYAVNEIANIDNLKMPSELFYTNQNDGATLFLNGNTYPLDVTGEGKYSVFVDGQLDAKKSNWIAVLTETTEDVDTATDVTINYDNRDLVGVPDV